MPRLMAPFMASILALAILPALAEDAPDHDAMMAAWTKAMTPGPEHQALATLGGAWKMTTTYWLDPSAPPEVSEGRAERRMILGGRVLEERVDGQMMGDTFQGIAQTGYDNVTGRYWATWTDDMSTGITLLYGRDDPASGQMVFEGETSDPMTGGLSPMRIESRMEGEDREVSTFFMPGPDGQMVKTMQIVYERH